MQANNLKDADLFYDQQSDDEASDSDDQLSEQ